MKIFRRNLLKTANNCLTHFQQLRASRYSTQIKSAQKEQLKSINDVIDSRSSICFGIKDSPEALEEALRFFRYNKIDMTRIYSQWSKTEKAVTFFVDMNVEPTHQKVKNLLRDLDENCLFAESIGSREVPWFPVTESDVDEIATLILSGGEDLEADHPGFKDQDYRSRRAVIADVALRYKFGDRIEHIDYTQDEVNCWSAIWDRLMDLLPKHACDEYLEALELMKKEAGYSRNRIPQLQDINEFVASRSGFKLRPTAGLLSSRYFLNGLAFRIFFCTQYLRHHSVPFYTPEPDLVHELIGHAPMFADPEFANFSQEIGLASIGATDEQIVQLARCYWFSVEFGLCKGKDGSKKAYGAGLLSAFGEMEHALSSAPEFREWDPFNAAQQPHPLSAYNSIYYVAESFVDAKKKMLEFSESLDKPFSVRWDNDEMRIHVDRNIARLSKNLKISN